MKKKGKSQNGHDRSSAMGALASCLPAVEAQEKSRKKIPIRYGSTVHRMLPITQIMQITRH